MSNQGLEVGISFTPIQKKDMELNINMNLSWQKNKLLSLSGEYDGMQMSAVDITAMGALSGAGQHGGYNKCGLSDSWSAFGGILSSSLQGNYRRWKWVLPL